MSKSISTDVGHPLPAGTVCWDDVVNFSVFSRNATLVWLELFDGPDDPQPSISLELDPQKNRTGDMWHIWVKGINPGQLYAFRVEGPYQPEYGHRFNRHRLLMDPYATALIGTARADFNRALGFDATSALKDLVPSKEDNTPWAPRCMITDNHFEWDGERPLKHPWGNTIIYETHVRGLTIHPSSGASHPGTFLGVIEKIPYFKELGITALELMPIQEFNENELELRNPFTGELLRNYWGYNTVSFFAPKETYGTGKAPGCQVKEFKQMVKELHKAGIEVILDIVLNHTAEGSELGPTLNFKGFENSIYYMLKENRRYYRNYSGCGNSLNCNHPVVRSYILDCLRYWVVEMHVDGFRFDLASVLGRDENGNILANPPLLETIAEDPILRDIKLIAEAWDAGGAYQVGSFPGRRWSEWNGRYRDDVRRFWRGDPGMVAALATRICGSADLYQRSNKTTINSINFITCHDGFTLNDLVSYREKHNQANGENNQDGENYNWSDNYGVEGETKDPVVATIRLRQIKNMIATLLISRGVPMILGGDEFRRTQHGNNNAYCQDNEISWYDWSLLERHRELFRFTCKMIAFRKSHKVLYQEAFYEQDEITWFNPTGTVPNWAGTDRVLGCMIHPKESLASVQNESCITLLFNAEPFEVRFSLLPPPPGQRWYLAANTALPSPLDIRDMGREELVRKRDRYHVQQRSMVILVSK